MALAQTAGKATNLSFTDFKPNPGTEKSWEQVADVAVSFPLEGKPQKQAGTGVILYAGNIKESWLFSKNTYGDIDLEFDFMLDKGASLAVMLQDRYKVNLSDSWQTTQPVLTDMGGIGPQKNEGAFGGIAPVMNVAKAPGLWQHARVKFRAPQFNGSNKTGNALFEEVYINGVLVQQSAEVQSPAAGSISEIEQATGPISFATGKGLSAIRNIKVTPLDPVALPQTGNRRMRRVANPILLNPEGKNYVLRSFVNFNGKKRTHVVSTGTPQQVNYSYDVKQGALFQVWHGNFMDVTEMWEQRGEPQLAAPQGNVIALSEAPTVFPLIAENSVWPDSVAFDDLKNLGYTLDKQRNPTFEYEIKGYHVADKLCPGADTKSLTRELNVTNAPKNLYCRLAAATKITDAGKGLYVIGDKEYYIKLDEKLKPTIRYSQNRQELLLPVEDKKTITYSLIW